jgi:hypothetical protein
MARQNGVHASLFFGVACLLLFFALAIPAHAQETTISRVTEKRVSFHAIDVYLDADGSANVSEQFFFSFFAGEADQFERDFKNDTPSLALWKHDYPFVHPNIGIESQAENIEFLLKKTGSDQPALEISYKYPPGLGQKVATENQGRTTRWKLAETALLNYISSGSINIDQKTQIKIHLPTNAVVDKRLLPQGILDASNVITLTNFQSNALQIEYVIIAPLADPIDASKLVSSFVNSPAFIFFIVLLGIVIAYLYINREEVSQRIENYVVEHSEFKVPKGPEVEEDLE